MPNVHPLLFRQFTVAANTCDDASLRSKARRAAGLHRRDVARPVRLPWRPSADGVRRGASATSGRAFARVRRASDARLRIAIPPLRPHCLARHRRVPSRCLQKSHTYPRRHPPPRAHRTRSLRAPQLRALLVGAWCARADVAQPDAAGGCGGGRVGWRVRRGVCGRDVRACLCVSSEPHCVPGDRASVPCTLCTRR